MPLVRAQPAQSGYTHVVGPDDSDLTLIHLGLLSLSDGASFGLARDGLETVLVVLGGCCDIALAGRKWEHIGSRADVFDGKPTAVYAPPGASIEITGRGEVELAVCAAPARKGGEPTLITPDQVGVRRVGKGTFEREIFDIAVPANLPAERLLVGETYNQPGRWSSYPPHKHDVHTPPQESKLEEVYHFRLKPPQGFGFQRIYGEGFDETYTVQHRDTVTIPRGFHPVAAAPGYQLYYLWILAGEERMLQPREDPDHSWASSQT